MMDEFLRERRLLQKTRALRTVIECRTGASWMKVLDNIALLQRLTPIEAAIRYGDPRTWFSSDQN